MATRVVNDMAECDGSPLAAGEARERVSAGRAAVNSDVFTFSRVSRVSLVAISKRGLEILKREMARHSQNKLG